MNKISTLLAVTLLWFSGSASAAPFTCPQAGFIEQPNQEALILDTNNSYCANIVVGGSAIWSTGLTSINPADEFNMTVYAGEDLIGDLFWSLGPCVNGACSSFNFGSLVAGEQITFSVTGSASASPSHPETVWFTFAAPDMPANSEIESSSVVPVPATVWLFGSGLLGLVGFARRRKVCNLPINNRS